MQNIIREGKVTATYPERCSCRVQFEDLENLVSAELPIIQPCAGGNKFYSLPDVGESVLCLFSENSDGECGFVIGSRYHEHETPKVNSQDKNRIDFEDGTFIEYDRKSHELVIHCVGNLKITAKRVDIN